MKPSCNFLRFPAIFLSKTTSFWRMMHTLLQKERHVSAGKFMFRYETRGVKTYELVVCFG